MKIYYLHGMGGSPADWDKVNSFTPGTALSVPRNLSFEESALALAEEISGEEPALLCGYSLGGRLAIRIASAMKGTNLKGVALLAAGLGFSEEESRRARRAKDLEWALLAEEGHVFWEKWYAQPLFASFAELPTEKQDGWLAQRYSIDIGELCHQLTVLSPASHGDLTEELLALPKSGISVLYIAGERDKKYKTLASELERRGVATAIFPGGHILPLESPKAVALAVRDFAGSLSKGK